ncbi:22527_t:CDS:2, partial [Dentiscutata erythropus]
ERIKAVLAESCELIASVAFVDKDFLNENNKYLSGKRMKMEGVDLLVSLVENVMKIVVEVAKNLKSKQVKPHRYKSRLCYVCRCKGHLAHDCPDQMKYRDLKCSVEVPKNGNVGINKMNELEKRKNYTYLNSEIEDIRLMRFEGNNNYVKSIQRRGGSAKIHKPRAKRKVNVSSSGQYNSKIKRTKINNKHEGSNEKKTSNHHKEAANDRYIRNLKRIEHECLCERRDLGLCNRNRIGGAVMNQCSQNSANVDDADGAVDVEHCCQDEVTVMLDAPLDVVMKIDEMMLGLLKTLGETSSDEKNTEEKFDDNDAAFEEWLEKELDKRRVMVSGTNEDVNNADKGVVTKCIINSDEKEIDESDDVNETSNEDESKEDLEAKIGVEKDIMTTSSNGEIDDKRRVVSRMNVDETGRTNIDRTCSFKWEDKKCCCTIRSGYNETTFVISEDFAIDEDINDDYVINKGGMMKNDDRRENELMDIRCVKGEAADGRTNELENYLESEIKNEKDKQNAFAHC